MKKTLLCLIVIFFLGCAQVNVFKKPNTDFSGFNKIAILRFQSDDFNSGQEVADALAISFMRKGYNVVERSQLKAILSETSLVDSGLAEADRKALKLAGINAVCIGTLTRYDCRPDKLFMMVGIAPLVLPVNDCHVSLSAKMLDIKTGDVVWAINGSHSKKDTDMTAGKVLGKIVSQIEDQIP